MPYDVFISTEFYFFVLEDRKRRDSQRERRASQQQQPLSNSQQDAWKYGTDFYEQQERDQEQLKRQTWEYYHTGGRQPPQPPQTAAVPDPNQEDGQEPLEFTLQQQQQQMLTGPAMPYGRKKRTNSLFLSTPAPQYAASIIVPKPEKMKRQVTRKWWPLSRNASTTAAAVTAAPIPMPQMPLTTPANAPHVGGTMSLTTLPAPPPQTMTIEIPMAGSYVIGGDEKARIRERIRRRLDNEFGGGPQTTQQSDAGPDADNVQQALEEQIATRTMKITRGGATATTTTTTKRNIQRPMPAGLNDDMLDATGRGNDNDVDELEREFNAVMGRQPGQAARRYVDNDVGDGLPQDLFNAYDDADIDEEEIITAKPMRKVNRNRPPGR